MVSYLSCIVQGEMGEGGGSYREGGREIEMRAVVRASLHSMQRGLQLTRRATYTYSSSIAYYSQTRSDSDCFPLNLRAHR